MTQRNRILVLIAMLFLALVFVMPLWKIDLWAPQYPEGLGMQIWLTKITGDIRNINLLNHYIGMHAIEPDSIPELRIFVYIFATLFFLGLLTAFLGRRYILYIYTIVFVLFSVGALYDFYRWEYQYGHDLDPNAAIIMEGESYQPPLIGKKQMMNIEAWSMPDWGGYGHIIALTILFIACGLEHKKWREETSNA